MKSRIVRTVLRAQTLAVVVLVLGACAGPGGGSSSSTRVEVPEPGAASARPPARTPPTATRTLPAKPLLLPDSGQGGDVYAGKRMEGAVTPPGGAGETGGGAYRPPPPPAASSAGHVPARSSNNAVNALLAQSDSARQGGNIDGAIAAAERALRIAPADPAVYYELASLRLARGERAVAEQLARKGLSYQPDLELRQRLEELVLQAHSS